MVTETLTHEQTSSRFARGGVLHLAPVGTFASDRDAWQPAGWADAESVSFGPTAEDYEQAERRAAMARHPAGRAWTGTIDRFRQLTVSAEVAAASLDAIARAFGVPLHMIAREASLTVDYWRDGAPIAPQRRPGWTARQYRAARRRYRREKTAWRKSGERRTQHRIYLPRVEVVVDGTLYANQKAVPEHDWTDPHRQARILAQLRNELVIATAEASVPQPTEKVAVPYDHHYPAPGLRSRGSEGR